MKMISLIALLGLSTSLFASFDFDFQCIDQASGSPVLEMQVSASGIGEFAFAPGYSSLEMKVSSQYADYGSIQVAFDEVFSHTTIYKLHLDMMNGTQWSGELEDSRGDFTSVLCFDRL